MRVKSDYPVEQHMAGSTVFSVGKPSAPSVVVIVDYMHTLNTSSYLYSTLDDTTGQASIRFPEIPIMPSMPAEQQNALFTVSSITSY